jgi:hypothetical protein
LKNKEEAERDYSEQNVPEGTMRRYESQRSIKNTPLICPLGGTMLLEHGRSFIKNTTITRGVR